MIVITFLASLIHCTLHYDFPPEPADLIFL
uniref:Uncharacterized protein n=1 Tax=Anopheles minimus TaxID=112268 RepID=A0A182WAM3_9DIPT